jgi:sporulation protein YlmC with PRC-barrel domain
MQTLGAIVLVASLVSTIALAGDAAAQTPGSSQAPPGQDSSQAQPAQPPASPPPASQPPDGSSGRSSMPPYPSPSPQSAGGGQQAQVLVDANAVIGSTVRDSGGKDIGRVSRLMIDPREGRILNVIIGVGGMMGVGEKLVEMPWSAVRIGQDGGRIVVVTDQKVLEQAPAAGREGDKKNEPAASPSTSSSDGSGQQKK